MASYFTVQIATKPYLKKYLEALYGSPVCFDFNSYFGKVVAVLLEKNLYPDVKLTQVHRAFDKYNTVVDIKMPRKWLQFYRYGTAIGPKRAVFFNKLLEDKFDEELVAWCQMLDLFHIEKKDALLDFCRRYDLEIDVDITFESIKRMEYRHRQKNADNLKRDLSPVVRQAIQASLF